MSRHFWQCLETFLVVTAGNRDTIKCLTTQHVNSTTENQLAQNVSRADAETAWSEVWHEGQDVHL